MLSDIHIEALGRVDFQAFGRFKSNHQKFEIFDIVMTISVNLVINTLQIHGTACDLICLMSNLSYKQKSQISNVLLISDSVKQI